MRRRATNVAACRRKPRHLIQRLTYFICTAVGNVEQSLDGRKEVRVNQVAMVCGYSLTVLRQGKPLANRFNCECDDGIGKPICLKELRAKANDGPKILYVEAAADSRFEFFVHSRLISSTSRKSLIVNIGI